MLTINKLNTTKNFLNFHDFVKDILYLKTKVVYEFLVSFVV